MDPVTGRCVGISDPELADQELAANSDDTRAPHEAARREGGGPGSAGDDEGPSLMQASARAKLAQAQLAEVKLAQIKGELVPAAEVKGELERVFRLVRNKLLGVPSRAVSVLQLEPAQAGELTELIREALEDLSEMEGT